MKYFAKDFTKLFSLSKPSRPTDVEESIRNITSAVMFAGFGSEIKKKEKVETWKYFHQVRQNKERYKVKPPLLMGGISSCSWLKLLHRAMDEPVNFVKEVTKKYCRIYN